MSERGECGLASAAAVVHEAVATLSVTCLMRTSSLRQSTFPVSIRVYHDYQMCEAICDFHMIIWG